MIQHSLDGADGQLVDQSLCLLLGADGGAALTDQSLNRALELVEYGLLSGDDLTHDVQSPLNQLLLVAVRRGQDIAGCLLNRLNRLKDAAGAGGGRWLRGGGAHLLGRLGLLLAGDELSEQTLHAYLRLKPSRTIDCLLKLLGLGCWRETGCVVAHLVLSHQKCCVGVIELI